MTNDTAVKKRSKAHKMKKTVEICSSFTGKITTGEYENAAPFFSVKEILEDSTYTNEEIAKRQDELQEICYARFCQAEKVQLVKHIEKERKDIRWYEQNGKFYPSVTSIIGWNADFYVCENDLFLYAAQGTITHFRVAHYIETGDWVDAVKIPECHKYIDILKKTKLKNGDELDIHYGNFEAFAQKYTIEFKDSEKTVYNDEKEYAGTFDFTGIPRGKEWEKIDVLPIPTLFDVKRTKDIKKNFKQLSAYAKCLAGIEQICIVAINDKTAQGYSNPTVTKDIDAYYKMFLQDLDDFKSRFNV